jgi:hypothetical protein
MSIMAVPWLRRLVACLSPWKTEFAPGSIHVGFVTDKVALKLKLSHYTPWRRLGEKKYSSYSYSNSVLDGDKCSALRPGCALVPVKGPPVPIVQEAGWAPELVWTQKIEKKSSCFCRGSNPDHPVVQFVVAHCTD